MKTKIEQLADGLWWRKNDRSYKYLNNEKGIPATVTSYCDNTRVIVQAGGHCGMFVKLYAELFNTVYTFEPDPVNFYCLTKNAPTDNVIKIQGVIGDNHQLISLSAAKQTSTNSGAFRVQGEGIVPTFKIDDLQLPVCDLIHLDIEGFEGFAIRGAVETIDRCNPVIAVEFRNFGEKYEFSDQLLRELIMSKGYIEVGKTYNDIIFKRS